MKILKLEAENFMNHVHTEVDFTNLLDVLIIGRGNKNEKISNGVGKSTIFTIIKYCLYNEFITTLDKLVKEGTKKSIVKMDIELDDIYRIIRTRTSSGVSNVCLLKKINDDFVDISARTPSETDALIKDLIKISYKAFSYSVLFEQADLTGITSVSDPKKRKEILKEPLNLGIYSKLEDIASKKIKPFKKKS